MHVASYASEANIVRSATVDLLYKFNSQIYTYIAMGRPTHMHGKHTYTYWTEATEHTYAAKCMIIIIVMHAMMH